MPRPSLLSALMECSFCVCVFVVVSFTSPVAELYPCSFVVLIKWEQVVLSIAGIPRWTQRTCTHTYTCMCVFMCTYTNTQCIHTVHGYTYTLSKRAHTHTHMHAHTHSHALWTVCIIICCRWERRPGVQQVHESTQVLRPHTHQCQTCHLWHATQCKCTWWNPVSFNVRLRLPWQINWWESQSLVSQYCFSLHQAVLFSNPPPPHPPMHPKKFLPSSIPQSQRNELLMFGALKWRAVL